MKPRPWKKKPKATEEGYGQKQKKRILKEGDFFLFVFVLISRC